LATTRASIIYSQGAGFAGSPAAEDDVNVRQQLSSLMSTLTDEIACRRIFAIISHPDAGATTLNREIAAVWRGDPMAGEVKARGEQRRVRSDWMAVERERDISASSAVMSFEHQWLAFNLLDTPSHQDFSAQGDAIRRFIPVSYLIPHPPVPGRSAQLAQDRKGAVM
jgi:hypothetical protein